MISTDGLVKQYGAVRAVDQLTIDVSPGRVTGFLGPNGSGKSTTMRLLLNLDRPNAGSSSFNGRSYTSLRQPLREVGALLDAGYAHPTRSARNHLRCIAASNAITTKRVDEVLGMVGLADVAGRLVKTYSLGMRQRLGLAAALLGDPHTLVLDEPANGLDPEGIRWIREFLSYLAKQGKTVFVSSHLLSEMALMADHLIVIGRGRLIEEGDVKSLVNRYADRWIRVTTPHLDALVAGLQRIAGATASLVNGEPCSADLRGVSAVQVGEAAHAGGFVLHELASMTGSLEDAFLAMTASSQEYTATSAQPIPPGAH